MSSTQRKRQENVETYLRIQTYLDQQESSLLQMQTILTDNLRKLEHEHDLIELKLSMSNKTTSSTTSDSDTQHIQSIIQALRTENKTSQQEDQ